ncbi:MAG: hypothetical protein ACLSWI_07510, partial [Candidatus Gastranaerophilaceae bacterium]
KKLKELTMSDFGFEINKKQTGLPKLPDNYWQNAKTDEGEINTIFDKNLNAALKDISIFEKRNQD